MSDVTPEMCEVLGGLQQSDRSSPLPGATGYVSTDEGDGMAWEIPAGTLRRDSWITFDALLEGHTVTVFRIYLREGVDGPALQVLWGYLNQCQARVRLPATLCDNDRWLIGREGGWIKVCCFGRRVDPERVTRIELRVDRKAEGDARWWQTPLAITGTEPETLDDPLLPAGALVDELGQCALHDWPGKTKSVDEMTARLTATRNRAKDQCWPESMGSWGGWREKQFDPTGFFRTHHDGRRWWLVDPDGLAFWSAGLDCTALRGSANIEGIEKALAWLPDSDDFADAHRPPQQRRNKAFSYVTANLIRAFGPEDYKHAWDTVTASLLRKWGFNTVGNWSDLDFARQSGIPYVRPMRGWRSGTQQIFRDFPDVFDPTFDDDAAEFAEQLRDTADDPALIGYFLMNEPKWGFATEVPAEGMLYVTERCHTRDALSKWLAGKYGSDAGLAEAWGMDVTFRKVAEGRWKDRVSAAAETDLAEFSTVMVDRLFGTLSAACRKVDPHHLNLGARYYIIPPDWALAGMNYFDVFSINCYQLQPPAEELAIVSEKLARPMLIGEWHFGAVDVGLPASGICRVADQRHRGLAYRRYVELAAAVPSLVGTHYFQLYDQSMLGRFDGENYNIGMLDVCGKEYEPLAGAARVTHERLYRVAAGIEAPFDTEVDYRSRLFY